MRLLEWGADTDPATASETPTQMLPQGKRDACNLTVFSRLANCTHGWNAKAAHAVVSAAMARRGQTHGRARNARHLPTAHRRR
jgi:hypothetical protein